MPVSSTIAGRGSGSAGANLKSMGVPGAHIRVTCNLFELHRRGDIVLTRCVRFIHHSVFVCCGIMLLFWVSYPFAWLVMDCTNGTSERDSVIRGFGLPAAVITTCKRIPGSFTESKCWVRCHRPHVLLQCRILAAHCDVEAVQRHTHAPSQSQPLAEVLQPYSHLDLTNSIIQYVGHVSNLDHRG
eukprot:1186145-Prorocentrum_minimum.AAC.3